MAIQVPELKSLGCLTSNPRETLTAALRRTLLDMILFGYFDSGKRLYPQELAEHFAVSPTPVREALMQLATDGYVEAIPRRGYRVRQPTAQLLSELSQVRIGLEITASEIAIGRLERGELSPSRIDALTEVLRQRERLGRRMTTKQNIEINAAFHQGLVGLSENSVLIGIYAAIQLQVIGALVQRGSTAWKERLNDDSKEHQAILKSLRARDRTGCASALRKHIERSLAGALQDIARNQSSKSGPRRSAMRMETTIRK